MKNPTSQPTEKEPQSVTICTTLPAQEIAAVEALAEKDDSTVARILRRCFRRGLPEVAKEIRGKGAA